MSNLKPFFSYYGGKYRAAPKYPVPRFGTIVEPFAGSAGYSMRYPDLDIVLIERNPVVAGVWRYLIQASPGEIESLPDLENGESTADLDVVEGARNLIGFWLNKGSEHPCTTPSAWMREERYRSQFWGPMIRDRISSQVERISHWRVIEASYEDAPDLEATWFVDPPYDNSAGRRYRFSDIDYGALGDWCKSRRGQVVVCENEGGGWLPFRPFDAKAKAMSGRGRVGTSSEVIWTND